MLNKNVNILILLFLLFGCSTQSKYSKTGAGIFTWKTDRSAAVTYPVGNQRSSPQGCMQMALSTTDLKAKVDAEVSDALVKALDKTPANASTEELLDVVADVQRTSNALNVSTEKISFLMVGSFYLCQLQANGLSEKGVVTLGNSLINGASGLGSIESD